MNIIEECDNIYEDTFRIVGQYSATGFGGSVYTGRA